MYIEQIYTKCLAEASYYIESNGEVAIIDPLRESEPYIELAKKRNAKIKYVFETHFHADFVSGHIDLARKTGSQIIFGPMAETAYEIHNAKDMEVFKIGDISLTALHTPGHTKESTVYLLKDEQGKDHSLFTGDTLFIGDVGRPDLSQKDGVTTTEDMAGMLYDSLRTKIMPLADDVIIYPAHGAGSACGKNISKETFSTLGNQKITNYALQGISREDFIKELVTGILPAPQYFAKNANLNKNGYESIDEVMSRGANALNPNQVKDALENGAILLDVRGSGDFAQKHIKDSLFIGLDGAFAVWVGTLIENIKQEIVVISDEGREEEATKRLARVGYDNCIGFAKGGVGTLANSGFEVATISEVSADKLESIMELNDVPILDVRKPGEYDNTHIVNANLYPLDFINEKELELDQNQETYVHCAGGYRSMIAISILMQRGERKLINVLGGMGAISKTTIPSTSMVCST